MSRNHTTHLQTAEEIYRTPNSLASESTQSSAAKQKLPRYFWLLMAAIGLYTIGSTISMIIWLAQQKNAGNYNVFARDDSSLQAWIHAVLTSTYAHDIAISILTFCAVITFYKRHYLATGILLLINTVYFCYRAFETFNADYILQLLHANHINGWFILIFYVYCGLSSVTCMLILYRWIKWKFA